MTPPGIIEPPSIYCRPLLSSSSSSNTSFLDLLRRRLFTAAASSRSTTSPSSPPLVASPGPPGHSHRRSASTPLRLRGVIALRPASYVAAMPVDDEIDAAPLVLPVPVLLRRHRPDLIEHRHASDLPAAVSRQTSRLRRPGPDVDVQIHLALKPAAASTPAARDPRWSGLSSLAPPPLAGHAGAPPPSPLRVRDISPALTSAHLCGDISFFIFIFYFL